MSKSRRLASVVAVVAALVLGIGLLTAAYLSRGEAPPQAGTQPAFVVLPPPHAGFVPHNGMVSIHPAPGKIGVATKPASVLYTFDRGVDKPITDTAGRHPLRALGQNGGRLRLVPKGAGLAVEYPDRCKLSQERSCPRAILEGDRDDSLNPGKRPMRYGASVLMTSSDLSDGANVLQKGYSVGRGSQFKLQVDHSRGHPSCVIAGRADIYRAESTVDVADGNWHNLACLRNHKALVIIVDGVERASVRVPSSLSIANAEPLRVGGKGAKRGNDQYAGQIDNVFLTIV